MRYNAEVNTLVCFMVFIFFFLKDNNKDSNRPDRLVMGCWGGGGEKRKGGKIAQQEAPDAEVFFK